MRHSSGQPRKTYAEKVHPVTVCITGDQLSYCEALADASPQVVSISGIIRQALAEYIENHPLSEE